MAQEKPMSEAFSKLAGMKKNAEQGADAVKAATNQATAFAESLKAKQAANQNAINAATNQAKAFADSLKAKQAPQPQARPAAPAPSQVRPTAVASTGTVRPAPSTGTVPPRPNPAQARPAAPQARPVAAGTPAANPAAAAPAKNLKPLDEIAKLVIRGNYGNGEARKKKLEAEGYDYATVQKRVNELLK